MSDKRQSSESLEASASELIIVLGQFLRRLRSEAGSAEFNVSQLAVISRLSKGTSLSIAELARLESMKSQSMGAILATLEEQELVQRTPHPKDKRTVLYALTDKGVGLHKRRRTEKRGWLSAAMATLTVSERKSLMAAVELMRKLAET